MDSLQSSMGLTSLVCTVLNFQLVMALAVESVADGNTDMAAINAVIDTVSVNLVTYLSLMGAWTAADSILFDIPQHEGGGDHRAMGAVDALDCGEGGGIAGTTRMTMTRKQTSASSPMAAAAAAAATTAIARCSTASGIATTTRGPSDDDGDVEAPAVRVTDW